VVIDGGIQVTVMAVHGEKVRLGIVAPAAVRVDRKEVHERRAEFDAGPAMVEVGVATKLPLVANEIEVD
jgi:carbon storage regulator CsrA